MNSDVTHRNRAAERIFGWTADDVIGQSITELLPESAEAGFFKMLPTLAACETYTPPSFMLLPREDGTEFPAEPSLAAWRSLERRAYSAIRYFSAPFFIELSKAYRHDHLSLATWLRREPLLTN